MGNMTPKRARNPLRTFASLKLRNEELYRLRLQGMKYKELGRIFDLSSHRCRQIFNRANAL